MPSLESNTPVRKSPSKVSPKRRMADSEAVAVELLRVLVLRALLSRDIEVEAREESICACVHV